MQAKLLLICSCIFFLYATTVFSQGRVLISDEEHYSPHKSAILDIASDNKGFLLPRISTSNRDKIDNPAESLIIYNIDNHCVEIYVSDEWHEVWCYEAPPLTGPCEGFEDGVDYQGQNYNVVEIGNQCWFAESLNVGTRIDSKDGSNNPIDQGDDCNDINKYCYNDDENNCDIYGGLYQWDQAMCGETTEGVQGICPDGWRIPTHFDFNEMEQYICSNAGHDNCETEFPFDYSTKNYRGNDEGARIACNNEGLWNESGLIEDETILNTIGYSALPGGYLYYQATNPFFININTYGGWWLSTENDQNTAWHRNLNFNETTIFRNTYSKNNGRYIRCIKDI